MARAGSPSTSTGFAAETSVGPYSSENAIASSRNACPHRTARAASRTVRDARAGSAAVPAAKDASARPAWDIASDDASSKGHAEAVSVYPDVHCTPHSAASALPGYVAAMSVGNHHAVPPASAPPPAIRCASMSAISSSVSAAKEITAYTSTDDASAGATIEAAKPSARNSSRTSSWPGWTPIEGATPPPAQRTQFAMSVRPAVVSCEPKYSGVSWPDTTKRPAPRRPNAIQGSPSSSTSNGKARSPVTASVEGNHSPVGRGVTPFVRARKSSSGKGWDPAPEPSGARVDAALLHPASSAAASPSARMNERRIELISSE